MKAEIEREIFRAEQEYFKNEISRIKRDANQAIKILEKCLDFDI